MIRLLHMAAITCLIASAGYAYGVKYDTLFYAEQVARLKGKLKIERDAVAVDKAEWALMTRPDRLQRMIDQNKLDLQPLNVNQLGRFSDLPVRHDTGDEIARKLEALGLEPTATATPKEKRVADPRSTGSITTKTPTSKNPAR